MSDFVLQSNLKSCSFWLSQWCFQKCQVFLLLWLFVMYYSLHYKLLAPTPARGQYTASSCSGRAGAIPRNFGRRKAPKSGVAPARLSLFSTVTFPFNAVSISFESKKLLEPQGDEKGEEEGGGRNPCLLHPFPSGSRSAMPTWGSNSVVKCAVTGWLAPPNPSWMSASLTRPAFHPRYKCSNRSPANRDLA